MAIIRSRANSYTIFILFSILNTYLRLHKFRVNIIIRIPQFSIRQELYNIKIDERDVFLK